jgi:anti-anti-sigma factor
MLAEVRMDNVQGVPVARVSGEVDLSNAEDVGVVLRTALEHVGAGLVIDFTPTTYLDSAGLHFIFDLGKRLRDRGQRLFLVVPSDSPVSSVLDLVRVDSLAPRAETLDGALERLLAHASDIPPAETA